MIRRKLTRIEVTLDDTKELDEFFTKAPQIGIASSATCPTSSNSKLTNLFYQKQLLLLGKKYDFNQVADTSLDTSSVLPSSRVNSVPTTSSTVLDPTNTVSIASSVTIAENSNLNETEERLTYNPQPYNPSNRFNQDIQ